MKLCEWTPTNFDVIKANSELTEGEIEKINVDSQLLELPIYFVQDYIYPWTGKTGRDVFYVDSRYIKARFNFDQDAAKTRLTEATLKHDHDINYNALI